MSRRDRSAYYRKYEAAHREQRRAKNVAYHARNREAILARSRARYAVKREADLARKRKRRRENPDEGLEYRLAYYITHAEQIRAGSRMYSLNNAEKRRAWRERHKERLKQYAAAWARANLGLKRAATARRFATKLRATPPWTDLDAINAFYQEAARMTAETGIKYEVDHICPLKSPLVCGLHVPWNLQLLTKTDNRRKWNRLPAA